VTCRRRRVALLLVVGHRLPRHAAGWRPAKIDFKQAADEQKCAGYQRARTVGAGLVLAAGLIAVLAPDERQTAPAELPRGGARAA
jgi:hypothetical protein